MKEIECEGKTVTIAVEAGLRDIGLRRDQVEVQVLDEGSAGILGFGMKPARVLVREKRWGEASAAPSPSAPSASASKPSPRARLSSARPARAPRPAARAPRPEPKPEQPRPEPQPAAPKTSEAALPRDNARSPRREEPRREDRRPARAESAPRPRRDVERPPRGPEDGPKAASAARTVLSELLGLAGLHDVVVSANWDAEQDRVQAEVKTADAAFVLGKDGRTLEALQFLTTIIVGRRTGAPSAVQVECQGWWKQIEERLGQEADRAAGEVSQTGKPFRFEPMDPAMRRLVHRRLAAHPDVETASEGEGSWRKVVVRLKRQD
ncbi:MAG: Jag N-terminal domain-containing protein [Elusimicrobia bacterium]|nr:Jag N-terminal domain-containing protein [Elusimicrobiota bacterium]